MHAGMLMNHFGKSGYASKRMYEYFPVAGDLCISSYESRSGLNE